MWLTEYSVVTDLPPQRIWRAIEQLHTGQLSYEGADRFEPHGPFQEGTEISVTPVGQDTMTSTIVELVENERYADTTVFGDLVLLFRYTLEAEGTGTRVTHSLEIDGKDAEIVGPELGPQISGDFPQTMDALLDQAARLP